MSMKMTVNDVWKIEEPHHGWLHSNDGSNLDVEVARDEDEVAIGMVIPGRIGSGHWFNAEAMLEFARRVKEFDENSYDEINSCSMIGDPYGNYYVSTRVTNDSQEVSMHNVKSTLKVKHSSNKSLRLYMQIDSTTVIRPIDRVTLDKMIDWIIKELNTELVDGETLPKLGWPSMIDED